MFLIPSKLTEESWLVTVDNTPPKQHDFGLSSRSVLQNSKTACHTWNKAKYLNNCAEKYKRFICHAAFNKTLLMLRIVSKSPIHSFILPERGNPCKEEKESSHQNTSNGTESTALQYIQKWISLLSKLFHWPSFKESLQVNSWALPLLQPSKTWKEGC